MRSLLVFAAPGARRRAAGRARPCPAAGRAVSESFERVTLRLRRHLGRASRHRRRRASGLGSLGSGQRSSAARTAAESCARSGAGTACGVERRRRRRVLGRCSAPSSIASDGERLVTVRVLHARDPRAAAIRIARVGAQRVVTTTSVTMATLVDRREHAGDGGHQPARDRRALRDPTDEELGAGPRPTRNSDEQPCRRRRRRRSSCARPSPGFEPCAEQSGRASPPASEDVSRLSRDK